MALCLLVLGLSGPAWAGLSICNRSGDILNVALAYDGPTGLTREGWWTLGPNQCADAITGRLAAQQYFLHAADAFGRAALAGVIPICVAQSRFRYVGAVDCDAEGLVEAGFVAITTGEATSWTVFLEPGGR